MATVPKVSSKTNRGASITTESASELRAPEGIRTPNLLIRRHGRVAWSGRMGFALLCSSGCLDAGLSSSLSSGLSSVIGCQIAARRRSMT